MFNVTQKDRVKKLYIGCHYQNDSIVARGDNIHAANDVAQFYAAVAAGNLDRYIDRKSRLGFFVQMPLEYIHFNFGGETRVFTMNQLAAMRFANILAHEDHLYDNDPFETQCKYVLCLDLERMAKDVFGSSNQSAMNIQVQLSLKSGALTQ